MNSVRTILQIEFNGEVRDLAIKFDLMDQVRRHVPWEELAMNMERPDVAPNFGMMAKFLYHNLKAAGFKPDIDDLYDGLISVDGSTGYVALVGQLIVAYMPRGKKKTVAAIPTAPVKASARKPKAK